MTIEVGKAMVWRKQGAEHTEYIPVVVRKVGDVLITVELADGSTRAVRPKRLRPGGHATHEAEIPPK
jgi:hypothetical protein